MKFSELTNRFVRGAIYSRIEETIYLVEANHDLFALRAVPTTTAVILQVEGSVNLEQSQLVSVVEAPPVKHMKRILEKEVTWCTRNYEIFTSLGCVKIVVTSDEVSDLEDLSLTLFKETGYPPEDAARLEDITP